MTGYISPDPCKQFFDNSGAPLAGGKLYTYVSGASTTPLPIYSDPSCLIPLSNPAILDVSGRLAYYIPTSIPYRFVMALSTANTNPPDPTKVLWTVDDVELPSLLPTSTGAVPPGAVIAYGGIGNPSGWLACDGTYYPQAQYPTLYAVIGTLFNTGGEPSNTFRVPNMQGRFPMGQATSGTGSTLGGTGGTIDHTHTVADHLHTIAHTHPVPRDGWTPTTLNNPGTSGMLLTGGVSAANVYQPNQDNTSGTVSAANSGTAALTLGTNNPPFTVVRFLIRAS